MNKCLDNLKNCNASCCRWLYFDFKFLTDSIQHYYTNRGCRVIRLPDRTWRVLVPHDCEKLSRNGKCIIHDSDIRPVQCKELDETTAHKYHLTEGCIYGKITGGCINARS